MHIKYALATLIYDKFHVEHSPHLFHKSTTIDDQIFFNHYSFGQNHVFPGPIPFYTILLRPWRIFSMVKTIKRLSGQNTNNIFIFIHEIDCQ